MPPPPPRRSGRPPALACETCSAPLSPAQRYCLVCGARARPLPVDIQAWLDANADPHRAFPGVAPERLADGEPAAEATPEPSPAPEPDGELPPFALPSPRAAAVAVLGSLAFGVAIGSANLSLASSPFLVSINHLLGGHARLVRRPAGTTGLSASTGATGTTGSAGGASAGASGTTGSAGTTGAAGTSGTTGTGGTTGTTGSGSALPPIKHVFVILLGEQGYSATFSPGSTDPYLSGTLARQGELVPSYYGVTQGELANEIALLSGQGPTRDTAADCPSYVPVRVTGHGAHHQILGNGCVYPRSVQSLPSELAAHHLTWRAYVEGLAEGRHGSRSEVAACTHPTLGRRDAFALPGRRGDYVTWRNPFVYFRSITGRPACGTDDVGLGRLAADLSSAKRTPNVSFVLPDACDDGSAAACRRGAKGGLAPANRFLKHVVPEIERSKAYRDDGLILITFDQAPGSGEHADTTSCCNEPTFPNVPAPTGTTGSTTSTTGSSTSTTADTTTSSVATTPPGATTTTGTATSTASGLPTVTLTVPLVSTTIALPPGTTSTASETTTSVPATSTTGTSSTSSGTTSTSSTTGTTTTPAGTTGSGGPPGGGQVGLLAISSFVKKDTTDEYDEFDHFSLLASIEKLFGLPRLGYADEIALPTFGNAFFNAYEGG